MTPLGTALCALAAEPAPKGTSPNVHAFVQWRLHFWADQGVSLELAQHVMEYRTREGTWERGVFRRVVAILDAHLAAETGSAS